MTISTQRQRAEDHCIGFEDVVAASKRIEGVAHVTPVLTSHSFNTEDHTLFFKVEALQRTGSFKFRGAFNAVQSLVGSEQVEHRNLHVVTHSSGNHAQALALAAKLADIEATIVMPRNAPDIKQAAVRGFRGNVVLVDNNNDARREGAARVVQETDGMFIHPSENPAVIAGQGTVCLELVSQMKELYQGAELDAVVIPVGGGGLGSGNAVALRGLLGDKVKIILAEPAKLDDAKRSFEASKLLNHHPDNKLDSVADGLKMPIGPNTWPIIRDLVDDIMVVSEDDILRATKLVWERLKVCIEPSAGVGVAVAMSQEFRQAFSADHGTRNVGIILCGGNVDIIKTAKRMEAAGL